MHFNILYSNHGTAVAAEDYLSLVRLTVEAAGHSAKFDESLEPGMPNIILEYFDEMHLPALEQVRTERIEYILVASEWIHGETFNDFDFGDAFYYSKRPIWKARFEHFLRWTGGARAIWLCTSDPSQFENYRRVTGKPVHELKTPYFKSYRPLLPVTPSLDWFFSGTLTPYRKQILERLARFGRLRHTTAPVARYIRDDYLARSRFCLDLRLCREYEQLSALRVWYQLMNSGRVICEKPARDAYLSPYVLQAPPDMFVETCTNALYDPACEAEFNRRLEAFRDETDARAEAERLLDARFARET